MTKIADDCLAIKTRMEEIAAERAAHIMGKPLEDAQPTEAPADIDFGMYAPCGYAITVNIGDPFTDFIG